VAKVRAMSVHSECKVCTGKRHQTGPVLLKLNIGHISDPKEIGTPCANEGAVTTLPREETP